LIFDQILIQVDEHYPTGQVQ